MKLIVLRLGHRVYRDHRITTHVALVARAFGADGIVFSGEKDEGTLSSLRKIVKHWGGEFEISYEKDWLKLMERKKNEGWELVHFSMYGISYQDVIGKIRASNKDKLLIVGGEKVPPEVYQIADYNIGVTNQPHSEVAALGVFLHDLFEGKELTKDFGNAHLKIVPCERGKNVTKK